MTMAVQSLDVEEREEMVKYMKESMAGTFFDRWLTMSGFGGSSTTNNPKSTSTESQDAAVPVPTMENTVDERKRAASPTDDKKPAAKRPKDEQHSNYYRSQLDKSQQRTAILHACTTVSAKTKLRWAH